MSDDIVTRLREYEAITDNAYVINALVAAADEIERLRQRLLMWRDTADALHYDYCCADGKAVLGGEEKYRNARNEWNEWEKAVRNEP